MFYKDRPTPYILPRATVTRGNSEHSVSNTPRKPPISLPGIDLRATPYVRHPRHRCRQSSKQI